MPLAEIAPLAMVITFSFIFGSCLGSFLNVCIWRIPLGESVVIVPSHCPKCNHKIRWFDNVPVIGFLALGGKCRETGEEKVIVIGLTGTGYFDMFAYERFNDGKMTDYVPTDEDLAKGFGGLPEINK